MIAAARSGPAAFGRGRLWLDSGDEDPFLPGIRELASALRASGAGVSVSTSPGGHEDDYWDAQWPRYARFYANALARCGR